MVCSFISKNKGKIAILILFVSIAILLKYLCGSTEWYGAVQSNDFRLYYKSSRVNPYIHYTLNNRASWTTTPGVKLIASEDDNHKAIDGWKVATISNITTGITFAMNDSGGNWDNNGGKDYTLVNAKGVFQLENGVLQSTTEKQITSGSPCGVNKKCVCIDGWTGALCDQQVLCDPVCTGNKVCNSITKQCECGPGWSGANCDQKVCNPACTGNKMCNTATGECVCMPGWTGSNCDQKVCDPVCTGNKMCNTTTGECVCMPGWSGSNCDQKVCNPACTGNKMCNTATGECVCMPGWTGANCDQKVCDPVCTGNRICNAIGECVCGPGWSGANCDQKVCNPACTGNNLCNTTTGICECQPSCPQGSCNDGCGGNCNGCQVGFYCDGNMCQPNKVCENNCSGNGICDPKTGLCSCNVGWIGSSCNTQQVNFIKIHYKNMFNYPSPKIHHGTTAGSTDWVTVPMINEGGDVGWTYTINNKTSASMVFTDGGNKWDNNNSANYKISQAGTYEIVAPGDIRVYTPPCNPACTGNYTCLNSNCVCGNGYTEQGIGNCVDNCIVNGVVCINGGTCKTGKCVCPSGWGGTNCEIENRELPNCDKFPSDISCSGSQTGFEEGSVQYNNNIKRRWQTPVRGSSGWQESFQDMSHLVGYALIQYTSTSRTSATVNVIPTHKDPNAVFTYKFGNNIPTSNNSYSVSQISNPRGSELLTVRIIALSNGKTHTLDLPPQKFIWQNTPLKTTVWNQKFKNGTRGSLVELFMWPYMDIARESEFLGNVGYMGAKLFPVHEQVMSKQSEENTIMNPWFFVYQPVSYNLDGRGGTRQDLELMIDTCRGNGVRVYVDVVLNHLSGNGNDMNNHRNGGTSPNCNKWYGKETSAHQRNTIYPNHAIDNQNRESPYYTPAWTYEYNVNTKEPPSLEFPGASFYGNNFHCERSLSSWDSEFIMANGWLVGLTDLAGEQLAVKQRQVAYMVDIISRGITGFRIDAAKHMKNTEVAHMFSMLKQALGGSFPDDFFVWCEVLTGGEASTLWGNGGLWDGLFTRALESNGLTANEISKIKIWADVFPKEMGHISNIPRNRLVIQLADHDQMKSGSSSRDPSGQYVVLYADKSKINDHRNDTVKFFDGGFGNSEDIPIKNILSPYWSEGLNRGIEGVPDGLSACSQCTTPNCTLTCSNIPKNVQSIENGIEYVAFNRNSTGYNQFGYISPHRDRAVYEAMQRWVNRG